MKYVVAVSGGVDSIVLLDMLMQNRCPNLGIEQKNIIVAHFDHGIRENSSSDEEFVRGVAGEYGCVFETERAELGPNTSEEKARNMRYNFLRRCCNKYNAQLITAHHQDDLLETMIINLIRGTNWHGLVSLDSNEILRPLLTIPKSEILTYATEHNLKWREDSTNTDQNYLRNYVRYTLLPNMLQKDPQVESKLLTIHTQVTKLRKEIATESQKYISHYNNDKWLRYELIMIPPLAALEIIYCILTQLDPSWHPSTLQLKRVLHFIKSASPGKCLEVSGHLNVVADMRHVQFKKT